ncbi:prophage LambdaCh01, nuclease domain protein [Flavobacteriaceae bacterium 3519-10]|nr:prophage LambdaCh01, nuclease domain protein [Flavobacteriaceae bacterium 3519-10]
MKKKGTKDLSSRLFPKQKILIKSASIDMSIHKINFKLLYLTVFIIFTFCQSKSETEIIRRSDRSPGLAAQSVETREKDFRQSEKTVGNPTPASTETTKTPYLVYKVVDGDTFWMRDQNNLETKVRLIGIDGPETRNTRKKKKGYYGNEAKVYLQSLILDRYVFIEQDVRSRDQYGRLLAYVYTENNLFVNADLIANGYAVIMSVPPNVKHQDEFFNLQQQARKNRAGMWGRE